MMLVKSINIIQDKTKQTIIKSNLDLFEFRFFKVPHVRPGLAEHERRVISIGFGQPDFVWGNVGVMPGLGSGFCDIRRVVHFEYFLLLSYVFFLLVPFFVPDHF